MLPILHGMTIEFGRHYHRCSCDRLIGHIRCTEPDMCRQCAYLLEKVVVHTTE